MSPSPLFSLRAHPSDGLKDGFILAHQVKMQDRLVVSNPIAEILYSQQVVLNRAPSEATGRGLEQNVKMVHPEVVV
jgi:hypothetical protein